ncbi:MAG: SRPBCC domain-containing protein [Bacteroidota bacterium]
METKTATKKRTGVENAVVIKRIFDIPVSKVWRALTNADDFKKWWGPEDYTCPYSKIEPRVGGTYFNCMRSPEGKDNWSIGTVKKLVLEKTLIITDSFSDEKGNIISGSDYGLPGNWPNETLIHLELEEADGATKLKLVHEGIPPEAQDDCKSGWNQCFDKLERNIN